MTVSDKPAETADPGAAAQEVAAIVIGRNEGARLLGCLESLSGRAGRVIYVDSGSTDGSVTAAAASAEIVALDESRPFTAARARNAGVAALEAADPDGRFRFLQFVDGDCSVAPSWIETARAFLLKTPGAGVVCGRRSERFPEASIYNRLCDMEWNTPIGRANACGGDSLMRREAFAGVGGFDPSLIAGEEPDLCFRLRQAGWTVWRLDAPMTLHDAAMTRFGQWWRRAIRGGWAFAEGAWRHGSSAERYNRRSTRSIALWGLLAPAATLIAALAAFVQPTWLIVVILSALVHAAMAARIALRRRRGFGDPWRYAALYGVFTMLSKPAQAIGMLRFLRHRLRGDAARIIEYKG